MYVGPVAAGDTLHFSYHGQYNSPARFIGLAGDSLWIVSMSTDPANVQCLIDPYALEGCSALISYADTVLNFITSDTSVYPTYTGHNGTAATQNHVDLELRVEYAGLAIPNYWVRIDTPKVRNLFSADSGGHSHSHTNPRRPVGTFKYPINFVNTYQAFEAQTDSTGRIRFRYVASQFGGVERIRARSVSDTTKFDTLSVKTRVPGLEQLADGTNFDLVGGTPKHHGPPGFVQDNNHYAAQIVRDSLPLMANVWVDSLANLRLFANDISLPYGGLFDHKGTWAAPHSTHRIGLDVDIRTELLTLTPPRQGVKIRNEENELVGNAEFEELAKRFGVRLPDIHEENTENEHYHLYYRSP